MSKRFLPAVAILAVAAGLYAVFNTGDHPSATPAPKRPDVPAITLSRADGGTFSSAALRGKSPLVISFFATWCGPCREELPHLIDLYQKHRAEGLQVVSITIEDADTVRRFAKEEKVPFPLLIDADHSISQRFNVASIPMTVVLDKHGRAAGLMEGYSEEQSDQIARLVEQLLKE
jgi:peroxiredoxin